MIKEILAYLIIAVVLVVILKLIKVKWKVVISLLINTLIGGIVLFLVNYIPFINLEINVINSLFVGVLGVLGVILLLVYNFIR